MAVKEKRTVRPFNPFNEYESMELPHMSSTKKGVEKFMDTLRNFNSIIIFRKVRSFYPFNEYESMKLPHMSPTKKDVEKFMDSVRNFNSRETDVLMCSAMKSGTHWVHEIVSMLLHQTTEYNSHGEVNDCNFECQTDWDRLEQWNSPRFFQTHLPLIYLPRKHVVNGYKIIYLNRNPKDRAVSNFHYMHKKGVPVGSWNEFFDNFVLNDSFYGGWFSFTKEFEKAVSQKRNNILPITFENLTTATIPTIRELATFLGVSADDRFIHDIADKCSFTNMKNNKTDVPSTLSSGKTVIWRKGIIGDWKNLFTVAQNKKI